jgi:hypothetical protein
MWFGFLSAFITGCGMPAWSLLFGNVMDATTMTNPEVMYD